MGIEHAPSSICLWRTVQIFVYKDLLAKSIHFTCLLCIRIIGNSTDIPHFVKSKKMCTP